MNANDVQQLFDRLGRFAEKIKVKKGDGYQWDYTFSDGVNTTYILRNIRNLNEIEDEITSYFIWVWNLKDYLKELSKSIGRDPKEIESFVNSDNSLTICADIATRLKHGGLNKSRSSLFPTLGKLNLSLTKEHLSSITFSGKKIKFDISKPNEIELTIPVYDNDGKEVGDGFKFLDAAISSWEKCFSYLITSR